MKVVRDDKPAVDFTIYPQGLELMPPLSLDWSTQRIVWFSHGFYKLERRGDKVLMSDLRMGQEPYYTFTFVVARRGHSPDVPVTPELVGQRPDLSRALPWLWRRALGEPLPPPR